MSEVHPDDIKEAVAEEYTEGLERLGSRSVLECSLCREIVKRLDQFVTNPKFIENASVFSILLTKFSGF